MAQRGAQLDKDKISCPICLDLLKDPVTVPCGHSYCKSCIETHWDGEGRRRVYSCPQCRKTFKPRPVLEKNTMLADLVEELKKTGLQAAPADPCYAGPEDVACDLCTGRKLKACKSCLQCLASYCDKHLQPQHGFPVFEKHNLMEPSKKLQEIKWSQANIQQRIQDREKDVELLQQELEAINGSADKAVEHSEKMFTELIRLVEKRRSDVKQQLRSQQQTEVSGVKELQEKLEQEITELKRKDAELHKLSHTQDHVHFLRDYPSLSALSPSTHSSSIKTRPLTYFEDVTKAVSGTRDKLQDALTEGWTNISHTLTEGDVLLPQPEPEPEPGPEPKTRAEFLKYSQDITLDPNTANTLVLLSEENRKATFTDKHQPYPDHPDRFEKHFQVLSRESLTGRCYWEVEWTGKDVMVAVSYKNISRAGRSYECAFGRNNKSWGFFCSRNRYNFWYNNVNTPVRVPRPPRVGVYLDHRAGILSFYSVSETMTLLYRVQTTFTQPLHAGLRIYRPYGSTAEFVKLK
ncbi:tripartite motif-containing protein 16-like protein [Halichoeres trimaculatus]|uniref:tripartite motif-containing protein 16-like protein n=1 Tax=Halichoeres trimaculatus TaxID=147232 RepID=UPI003D9F6031